MENDKLQLFENKKIRTAWDEEQEEWYFSIVDVVAVLTDSPNPQTYWRVMKKRLKDEGNETVTNCNALKMTAADGKKRLTDVATTEQLLRIMKKKLFAFAFCIIMVVAIAVPAFAAEPPQWSEGDTTVIDLTYEEFIKKLQN